MAGYYFRTSSLRRIGKATALRLPCRPGRCWSRCRCLARLPPSRCKHRRLGPYRQRSIAVPPTSWMAKRSEPAPLSFVLVTTWSAACAKPPQNSRISAGKDHTRAAMAPLVFARTPPHVQNDAAYKVIWTNEALLYSLLPRIVEGEYSASRKHSL